MARKSRRRVVRLSDAKDYDRHADEKVFVSSFDSERKVALDDEPEELTGLKFYKEQMPPHYGE